MKTSELLFDMVLPIGGMIMLAVIAGWLWYFAPCWVFQEYNFTNVPARCLIFK